MPYENMPEEMWPAMDRCVERVMGEGHDKESAIGICYTSMMKAEEKAEKSDTVKALELSGEVRKLLVLGAPYYGPHAGKDLQGEYFDVETDFMTSPGDTRPVIYMHGLTPSGQTQREPEVLGQATAIKRDERGLWFEVILEKGKALAERIWKAAKEGLLRASTGAVSHLVRVAQDGHILTWPIGELSLLDVGGGREPANGYAVAMPLKIMYAKAGIQLPEAFREADEDKTGAVQEIPAIAEDKQTEEVKMAEGESLTLEAVMGALDARDAAKKAKEDEVAKIKAEAKAEALKELEAKQPAWKGGFSTKRVTELGLAKDDMKSFGYWLRTGDMGAVKAALQEGTASEGGVIVPDDFFATVVEKRNAASWLRGSGVTVIQTSRDVVNIPYQSSTDALFVVAAEEAAYNQTEPTLDQVAVTVHKWTNLIKVSEELLTDQAANLEAFLSSKIAEKMAMTEGYYAVLGTGSSQHAGVIGANDSDAITIYDFASAAQIEPSEIMAIPYQLNSFYRSRATWAMVGETEAYLRGLETSNHFAFSAGPEAGGTGWALNQLLGRPLVNQDGMASIAASAKVILFGDWSYFTLVENGSLTIARNPYLYQANGQVGIFSKFRQGGAATQLEAFVVARQSA